eukprot:TRINITY_DN12881_c0_g1_i1.p1 TRINITY_DN12881_c0_g1~~TRINITY_DN12881_c0_g1_i1.p1  ORF type:complete len:149 (-),score=33.06 TRINITY_DN12881_c0_g1_i1:22-468(-)
MMRLPIVLVFCYVALGVSAADADAWQAVQGADTKYQIIVPGKDDAPSIAVGDKVTVHATGIVAKSDKKFWSTKDKGQQPFTYNAGGGVIKGWDMGSRGMKQGETRRLKIPAAEGYGARGFPSWGIPENADLIFELEVLSIKKKAGSEL